MSTGVHYPVTFKKWEECLEIVFNPEWEREETVQCLSYFLLAYIYSFIHGSAIYDMYELCKYG